MTDVFGHYLMFVRSRSNVYIYTGEADGTHNSLNPGWGDSRTSEDERLLPHYSKQIARNSSHFVIKITSSLRR